MQPQPHPIHLEPVVSLREYLDMRLDMHRQAAIEQNRLQVEFNNERRQALERRMESEVTHLQLALENYKAATVEYRDGIERRIRQVETFQANINGRIIGFSAAFGIVGALLATIINFIHP